MYGPSSLPIERVLELSEIATYFAFLHSDEASDITASARRTDAGWTTH